VNWISAASAERSERYIGLNGFQRFSAENAVGYRTIGIKSCCKMTCVDLYP